MRNNEELVRALIREGYLKTPRIIRAFRAIDRADFVLPEHAAEAYGNYPLPIGEGQTISQPLTVAFMFELLDPRPGEKIMDIGSGSGWTSALLAAIVGDKGRVYAIERIESIYGFGKKNAENYNFVKKGFIEFFCQDGALGVPERQPFDKILAGAAASRNIPQTWRDQLRVGGRIVAPVKGSVWLFIKKSSPTSSGRIEIIWEEKEFPGFAFVPLVQGHPKHETKTISQLNLLLKSHFNRILLVFITAIGLIAVLFTNEIYRPHTSYRGAKTVEISLGLGSRKIAEVLKREGIIRSKWAFLLYASLKGKTNDLKPGIYQWVKVSIPEIIRDLTKGNIYEQEITILEGWSVKDIAQYLVDKEVGGVSEFAVHTDKERAAEWQDKFSVLKDKPQDMGLEGYLFPDTYRIFMNTEPQELIEKMLQNFEKKLTPELRDEIGRQGKRIFEIITMASLIEKEVASDEDRAIVSGILWKRIKFGIPIQVDATITYIINKRSTKISIEETKIDSPYNTYRYRGLPKGPIANPGISAIRAAIYPKSSPYFYYLSTLEGKTIFSKTLEEHNHAKAKYLK